MPSAAQTCTAMDIAELCAFTKRGVNKRAARESWPYVVGPRRSKLFLVERLPEDVRSIMEERRIEQATEMVPMPESKGIERVNGRAAAANVIPFNNMVLAGSRVPAAVGDGISYQVSTGDRAVMDHAGNERANGAGSADVPVDKDGERLPAPARLAGWQRDVMDARCVVLAALDAYVAETGTLSKAIGL